MLVLTASTAFSQNTFTFNGIGDWTDTTKWNNYPGTTVDANEIIEIYGKVTIAQATVVTNNGEIFSFSSANGDTPAVNILGSLINNKNINFSTALINVAASGSITANLTSELIITNSSKLTNLGNITISGGIISTNSLSSSITNDGNGFIENNGMIKVLGGVFENKSIRTGSSVTNNGMFEITNGRVINNGIFFNNTNGKLLISRTFTNESTGKVENNGQITVTGFGAALINSGNLNNNKNINLDDSAKINMAINSSIFTNQNTGIVVVSSDSKIENNSSNFSIEGGIIKNGGTIDNNTSISLGEFAELENNGTLNNNFEAQINNSGTISGINTVHAGSFSNGGILSPGNKDDSTGFYKLDSFFTSYTQTSKGSLKIDLGGTIAGDNYDQIIVNRNVTLDGTLNVSLVDGFEPAIGDVFTILTKGRSISGTFSTVNLPALSADKVWDVVEYGSNGVRLLVEESRLSVSDINKDSLKFKAYPNPVQNVVNLEIDGTNEVEVFDTNGRFLIKKQISENNSSINVSSLSKGIYILKVLTGNGIENIKIIKE